MIIIPDIHGRTFWKKAVAKADRNEKIIFLGDYVDPYLGECDDETGKLITKESALSNFKEIINFKNQHPDQVILLLGNHDTEYFVGTCASRCDYDHQVEIESLFTSNIDDFLLGYHCVVNGQKYTFSHSCITEGWAKQAKKYIGECHSPEEVIDQIDSLDVISMGLALNQIGASRCGHEKYGSMIWADVEEAYDLGWSDSDTYQIFSHTQQLDGRPYLNERFAMLDVRRAFRLDETSNNPFVDKRIVEL